MELFDVPQDAARVAGLHRSQSSFQSGDQVQQGAGVCLQDSGAALALLIF